MRRIQYLMVFFSAMMLHGLMMQISEGSVTTNVSSISTDLFQSIQQ